MTENPDRAFTEMTLDILSNILSRADNPADLGEYLTVELRELTGARCVLLVEDQNIGDVTKQRVISINPHRKRAWAESPDALRLYALALKLQKPQVWCAGAAFEPCETHDILQKEEFFLSILIPLRVGNFRIGELLLLGLPEEYQLDKVINMFDSLSTIVALVLRNAFFFEQQERIIGERTRELQNANVSIRQHERMLDSVLNSIPQAVYWKDRESKYIGCNDLFARTVGIDRKEDVTGKTDIDLPWTAGHAHAYRADDREVIESKKPKNHIIESAVLADGSHIWVDTSTIPLVNDIGQVEGVIGIYDDVTERKMAEENLSRSERNYREIFNATGDALLILDETGRIHDVNQQMCKMFGCDRETALLTNVKDLSSEESQSSHNGTQNDFSGAAKHAHQICQWKCRRFSGELFWTEVVRHASVISGDMRIIVSMRDITERKQAVEALHREKKFTQAILENMVDGVVVCDQEGKLVLFNKTARLWHGLDPSKIPQEQWARHYDLYFSDGITPMSAATVPLARAFRGEVLQDAGMVILAKGKPALHILTNCAPFFDEQGRLLGAVAVMHDITERKKGEEALKKSQRLLSETEKMGKVGGWELNIDTGKQTWTEELYEIHEVALDYQPTLEGGIKFYSITSLPVIRQAIQRAIEQGEPFDLELEIITAKGNLRHVHAIGQPDLYQRRIYGFFQDISERKARERELIETKAILQAAMDQCPVGIAIADAPAGVLRYVNDAGMRIRGGDPEAIINGVGAARYVESWKLLDLDKTPLKTEEVPLARAILFGQINSREFIVQREDNAYRRVLGRAAPIRDDKGKITAAIVVFDDITEAKESQESLQHLNRDLRALSNCNQVLVRAENEQALLDTICQIICNDAGYAMAWVGFVDPDRAGLVRRVAAGGKQVQLPEDQSALGIEQDFWQGPTTIAIKNKQTFIINDFKIHTIEPLWCDCALILGYNSAVVLPLIDDKGGAIGALSIYSFEADVFTPAEIRLLEELSGDLSYGISNLRARKEKARAEEDLKIAFKEKEALLEELYHRTKNNMQVISALLEMRAILSENEELQQIFREMEDRIRAMALVHEKLYQSQNLSMVDLGEYISDLGGLLLKSYASVSARVNLIVKVEQVMVTIDIAVPCGQVVVELLSNCFKYAFPDHQMGTIELNLSHLSENEVALEISDDGAGKGKTFDISRMRSLGIPLMVSIVKRQLHGSMNLSTEKGFCWLIRIRTDIYRERV